MQPAVREAVLPPTVGKRRILALIAALMVAAAALFGLGTRTAETQTTPPAQTAYDVKDLGTLGGIWSFAWDVNDSGQVVGESYMGNNSGSHAFLYEDGQMKDLGTSILQDTGWSLTENPTGPIASINSDGQIAAIGTKGGLVRALLLTPSATPEEQIQTLEETIQDLNLSSGTTTSLQAKLDDALSAVEAGDKAAACTALNDFVNHVQAQAGKKKISASEGQTLIEAAERIMTALGCQ